MARTGRDDDNPGSVRATWSWREGPVAPGPAVVFDLDGVLSDASGRQHYLTGEVRDWVAFFRAARADPLIPEVARLLELLDPSLVVILLTARPGSIRAATIEWLERFGLSWDLLVMRGEPERLTALEFKRRETRALHEHGFDLRLALEDDRRNLEMFEEEGVPCLYVHSGYYG